MASSLMDHVRRLANPREPWFDLVYLGFFFFGWWGREPSLIEIAAGLGSLALFITGYALAMRWLDWRVLVISVLGMMLGLAWLPYNPSGIVFMVYAAPMLSRLPDASLRTPALLILGPVIAGLIHFSGAHWIMVIAALVLTLAAGLTTFTNARRSEREEANVLASAEKAAEAERARIARDLHDLLGHTLSVVTLKADIASRLFDSDPGRAKAELVEIQSISRTALAEVREAVTGLRDRALGPALVEAERRLSAAGLSVSRTGELPDLPAPQSAVLAMAVRESVTNILRHAQASSVEISTGIEGGRVVLRVQDDGRGGADPEGGGLSGLGERLAVVGGRLTVTSEAGTRIDATLPLKEG